MLVADISKRILLIFSTLQYLLQKLSTLKLRRKTLDHVFFFTHTSSNKLWIYDNSDCWLALSCKTDQKKHDDTDIMTATQTIVIQYNCSKDKHSNQQITMLKFLLWKWASPCCTFWLLFTLNFQHGHLNPTFFICLW